MNNRVKYWHTARCDCVRPIIYQAHDRYPMRCARCGGHLYSEPRPPHFERVVRRAMPTVREVLTLIGYGILALLAWLFVALAFVVLGGQP